MRFKHPGRLRPCSLLAAVALLAAARTGAAGPAPPDNHAGRPTAVVVRLQGALLDVMRQAESLGYEGRRQRLAPVIEAAFDLPFMAHKVAGRHWKTLSEADRQRLVDAFSRLAVATYAARFDGYSGERFEAVGEEAAGLGTEIVRTRLVKGNGDNVRIDYRLRPVDGGWRIIDVFLNGTVSELALRRAEYGSVMRREGFAALLRALEEKISDYERGASS